MLSKCYCSAALGDASSPLYTPSNTQQSGRGVDTDMRLALSLFKRAADLGDPEAHGQMGLRYATGLARPDNVEGASIKHFDAVRWLCV